MYNFEKTYNQYKIHDLKSNNIVSKKRIIQSFVTNMFEISIEILFYQREFI